MWVRSCGAAGLLMDGRTGSIIFGHGLVFTFGSPWTIILFLTGIFLLSCMPGFPIPALRCVVISGFL